MSHDIMPYKVVLLGKSWMGKKCTSEKYLYNFDENMAESIRGINHSKILEFPWKQLNMQLCMQ